MPPQARALFPSARASVMPSIVRGNTIAAVIATVEQAADDLLGKRMIELVSPTALARAR
jgi:choline dehydrogenase-like flavoprotein